MHGFQFQMVFYEAGTLFEALLQVCARGCVEPGRTSLPTALLVMMYPVSAVKKCYSRAFGKPLTAVQHRYDF